MENTNKNSSSLKPQMLLRTPTSLKWRNQIKQKQLISQISSILLQTQQWLPLIQKLNLSPQLNSTIFLQILKNTQNNPKISLGFFNWAKTKLGFTPDVKSHYKITQILLSNGFVKPARPILDSLMQSEPVASRVLDSLINGSEFHHQSFISSFVLECYVAKGLVYDGLVLFSKIRSNRYKAETRGCIALLDALQLKGEVKMGWCFCGAIVRYGVFLDSGLVSVIARLLCKHGKVENAAGLLKSGVCSSRVIYGLVIDCYCKKGDFTAAVELLSDMYSKRLSPDFDIYSSMLDGACRFRNSRFVEMMVDDMFAKGFLPDTCFLDYNMIIEKLCKLRKTYAAEMFFERALVENSCLRHALYGSMLLALCKEAQVKEAMTMYKRIRLMGITFNVSCYFAFASILCNQEPSLEVERLLTDLIERGFLPSVSDLSKFLATQCNQGRWKQAEGLINIITEKGILPDFLCCCSLVEHYCSNKQIDLAVGLHDKMEKLGGTLDVVTYNGLLIGLFKGTMIEETIRVFDYMRKHNIGSSVSYSIMITGLCHAKEMRKAMKFHDEMLEMRLKPNEATYKRLVGRFCN